MVECCDKNNYKIALGSCYPHDAQMKISKINSLYLKYRIHKGAIIIIHDRPWTINSLRDTLPILTKKYKFVTLSELDSFN